MSLPTKRYQEYIAAATALAGLPDWAVGTTGQYIPAEAWFEALILHESSGNPTATHVDLGFGDPSLRTSYGLCQIEGVTALALLPFGNVIGPYDFSCLFREQLNISLGLTVLVQNIRQYGTVARALAAYNSGHSGAVVLAGGKLVDQVYVDAVAEWCPKVLADR